MSDYNFFDTLDNDDDEPHFKTTGPAVPITAPVTVHAVTKPLGNQPPYHRYPNAHQTPKVMAFSGRLKFLSNFQAAPTLFEGVIYPTAEHAFQAAKTTDLNLRKQFASHNDPLRAKRDGKLLTLRSDWPIIKLNTMLEIVRNKFVRNEHLGQMLLATGDDRLVHDNYWKDTYWGTYNGIGSNHLGEILMIVREELRGDTGRLRVTINEGDFIV